jgi:hypothetical protein
MAVDLPRLWDVFLRRSGVVTVRADNENAAISAARAALYGGAVELTDWLLDAVPHSWSQPPNL